MTREDPDGIERLILVFCTLTVTTGYAAYPFISYCFLHEDIELYKHLLYFLQAFLPRSTALIVGWAVTGTILNLLIVVSYLCAFIVITICTIWIVSETLWMIKLRELW